MGKVYAPEVLRAEMISPVPRHREAAAYILQNTFPDQQSLLSDNDGTPLFRAGMAYGSSIDGPGPNIRSDLDIHVVSAQDGERKNEVQRVFEGVISEAERRFRVSAEGKVFGCGVPKEEVDSFYAEHIVDICRRFPEWCRQNPAKDFEKHLLDPNDWWGRNYLAAEYLYTKAVRFDDAIAEYAGFADYAVLQRVLELSSAICRKVLPITQLPGEKLPPISDKPAMRSLMEQRITDHFGRDDWIFLDNHKTLAAADARCTQLIEGVVVTKKTSVNEYEEWAEDSYLDLCHRAQHYSRGWAELVENRMAVRCPERMEEFDSLRLEPLGSS